MSRLFLLFAITFSVAIASAASAQPRKPIGRAPSGESEAGRTAMPERALLIPDSAAFNAAFNTLWPLVQPEVTVRERVQKRFKRTIRNLKTRGVDTVAAYTALMQNVDTSVEYNLLRTAFARAKFTPEDLRSLATFYKSPVGRKYLDAQSSIADARSSEIDRYVQRLFNSVITPMMKPKEAKPMQMPAPATDSTEHVATDTVRHP